MKVFEGLASAVRAEGARYLFGLLGGGNERFAAALTADPDVRWIATRHEQAAVGMADGFARASGEPAVAALSHGPGITNAATHMTAARLARSPLLVVCGDHGADDRRTSPMSFDQEPLLRATIGSVTTIAGPRSLTDDLDYAFRQLRTGGGPVALNLPSHVDDAELPESWAYEPRRRTAPVTRVSPDRGALDRVVEEVQKASRIVILAGRGAVAAGARDALVGLADRTGAVLATTLLARGLFRGCPADAGISGGFGAPSAQRFLREADLVLSFGASLNHHTTNRRSLYRQAVIVHVDTRREAFDVWEPADIGLVGDCALTAELLSSVLDERGHRPRNTPPVADLAAASAWEGIDLGTPDTGINPHAAVRLLDEALPTKRLVGTDIGWFMGVPGAHMDVAAPEDAFYPWFFGGVGSGLSEAMGATLARPDLPSVFFIGDGGLLLALSDLETMSREQIPMLVVVVDDGGFGAERLRYGHMGLPEDFADYRNPDLSAVARALGLRAFRADDHASLERAIAEITATPESVRTPTLLHLVVDRWLPSPEMDRAYGSQ